MNSTGSRLPRQRWQLPTVNPAWVEDLVAATGLSPLLAQVLVQRGITTPAQATDFLNPERLQLPSPLVEFPDLAVSLELLVEAIQAGRAIAICGDYDADGMTSTALLLRALRILGATVNYTIPSRMSEGYGINQRIVEDCYAEGVSLILTVDNGIAAVAPIQRARELGLAVIITDHHDLPPELPPANAILNPKLLSERSPYRGVAGVGVAYILAVCLAQTLDQTQDLTAPLLELFTLGTIADLAPLVGVNRRWVRRGLGLLPRSRILGIQALIQAAGLADQSKSLKPEHIGFRLGPRINAVGRISDPQIVIDLLTTEDVGTALERAMQCEQINATRQDLCQKIEQEAIAWCEQQQQAGTIDLLQDRVLLVVQPAWHHGVIGIVASRLVERYGVPVFIGTYEGEDQRVIRGSARGIPEFDVFAALQHCADLMEKFGGHRAAGGFSFLAQHLPLIKERLVQSACQQLTPDLLKPLIAVDAQARLSDVTFALYEQIDQLHPCGIENPDPVFWTPRVNVLDQQVVGRNREHLKLTLSEGNGGATIKAIAWRWGEYFPLPEQVDIAYKLKQNEWQGVTAVELELVGVRASDPSLGTDSGRRRATPAAAPMAPTAKATPVLPKVAATGTTPRPTAFPKASPIPIYPGGIDPAATSVVPSTPAPTPTPSTERQSPQSSLSLSEVPSPPTPYPSTPTPPPVPQSPPAANSVEFSYSDRRYSATATADSQSFTITNPEGHVLQVNLATGQGSLTVPGAAPQELDITAPRYGNLIQAGWQVLESQRLTQLLGEKESHLIARDRQVQAQAAQLAEQTWQLQAKEAELADLAKQIQQLQVQLQAQKSQFADQITQLTQQIQALTAQLQAPAAHLATPSVPPMQPAPSRSLSSPIQPSSSVQTNSSVPEPVATSSPQPSVPLSPLPASPRSAPTPANAAPQLPLPALDLQPLDVTSAPATPPPPAPQSPGETAVNLPRLRQQVRTSLGDQVWFGLAEATQQDLCHALHQRDLVKEGYTATPGDYSAAALALVQALEREICTPFYQALAEYSQLGPDPELRALATTIAQDASLQQLPARLADSWPALSDKALKAANKPRKALYETVLADEWSADWPTTHGPITDSDRGLLDEFLQAWNHPLGRWLVTANETAAAGIAQVYQLQQVALSPDRPMPQWQYQLLQQMAIGERRKVGLLQQIFSEPSLFA